jgi:hypothetical protein
MVKQNELVKKSQPKLFEHPPRIAIRLCKWEELKGIKSMFPNVFTWIRFGQKLRVRAIVVRSNARFSENRPPESDLIPDLRIRLSFAIQ